MESVLPSEATTIFDMLSTSQMLFQNESIFNQTLPAFLGEPSITTRTSSENLIVMPVYPPTQEPSTKRLFITMYLIVCLTIGICGNFSQLALQYYSYRLRIYKTTVSPTCTQLYVCLLHSIYFLISISLPSVIIEHLVQIWMFGMFTCVSHLFLITTGRTAAAWLTVMLFLDQWRVQATSDVNAAMFKKLVECKSKNSLSDSKKVYFTSLLFIVAVCLISCFPSLFYIDLSQEVLYEEHVQQMVLKIRTFKCSSKIPENMFLTISTITFFLDFLIPFIFIVIISIKLYRREKISPVNIVYQKKLRNYRLLVAILYFFAYSAHWVAVTWVFIGVATPEESVLLGDLATLFPYTLPAVIWLPLSLLSSSASAQARFYDPTTSSRINDPISEGPRTTRGDFPKQKRNTRWSTESKLSNYIHSSDELNCDFKNPCAWNNVDSDNILDTSDFYTFEKKDGKTFPIQVRPGSANPKQGSRFVLAGNTTAKAQSAVLVSAPIACQVTKGKLAFKYWLYNSAKIEVVILKINPSHGHWQVKFRPKTDCHFLKHLEDECIVEIDETHEPFKIGIRAYQLHDSSVGSFVMLSDIRYKAQICREHEVPSLFGGVPLSTPESSLNIIHTASDLNCTSNVGSCNWKPTYPTDTTNLATLRSLWQTGMNQRLWDEFVPTTDDSHPEGGFLFQYIDPMSTLPIGQLQSALVPCTQTASTLQFRYWMSPNVQAQLCTVTKANVSLSCVFLSEANSPGPITIDIDRGDKNPFRFVIEVIRFDPSRTSVFAIDDIVFKSILCHEEAPKTTPAPLGIGILFDLQPFPDVAPDYLPSKLDCNYEVEHCIHWENLDGEFQSGFVPAKLPFEIPKSFRGNAAIAHFTASDSFAVLQSPVISCAKDARITVKYFSSIGARLSICADNNCLKERDRSENSEENNSPSNFGHSGELSVNVTSVKNFRLSVIGESYVTDGGVFAESFIIIKEIKTEGHLCRMKDRTELACEVLSCDFRKGTLCNYQSALTSPDDIPFQHDKFSGITATLATLGRRRVVLRSPEFQLSRPADLKFKLMLSTYGAEAYICPDEFVDNLTEDCELILGPKIDEKKFEILQVQLDKDLQHFAIIAFHDKYQQFGEADVAITDIQLIEANGDALCH